jgi:hypothetical protein
MEARDSRSQGVDDQPHSMVQQWVLAGSTLRKSNTSAAPINAISIDKPNAASEPRKRPNCLDHSCWHSCLLREDGLGACPGNGVLLGDLLTR